MDCYQSFYINMLVGFAWLPECFYLTDKWECGLSISCLCALARFFLCGGYRFLGGCQDVYM